MTSKELSISNSASQFKSWSAVTAIVFFYAALYAANYALPLKNFNYTSRIWNWSQTALMVAACLTLIGCRHLLTARPVLFGLVLSILSTLSHWVHHPSLLGSLQEGMAVWACFSAGTILFQKQRSRIVPAFQAPLLNVGKSFGLGILFAIPLAIVNNLYFYFNAHSVQWQNVFSSAFAAISPAIHEEVIFRFFVLALTMNILQSITSPRYATVIAVVLGVVPHSLNHLPDLFLENPIMGLFMLAATSLLFGLPMAILQIRKNLETAIAFHWFIDFARFLFGF